MPSRRTSIGRGRGPVVAAVAPTGLGWAGAPAPPARGPNEFHGQLLPGGTTILGNFDVGNPDRAFLDHLAEWRLIHRTADDLRALFARSRFGDAPVDVRAEEEGVNLFAFCTRR